MSTCGIMDSHMVIPKNPMGPFNPKLLLDTLSRDFGPDREGPAASEIGRALFPMNQRMEDLRGYIDSNGTALQSNSRRLNLRQLSPHNEIKATPFGRNLLRRSSFPVHYQFGYVFPAI